MSLESLVSVLNSGFCSPHHVGGDDRTSVVSSTVVDGVDDVGVDVDMLSGADQVSVSDDSESDLGDVTTHYGDATVMFSWYLSHSTLDADTLCLSVSGLVLAFFFTFCGLSFARASCTKERFVRIALTVSSCLCFHLRFEWSFWGKPTGLWFSLCLCLP